MENAPNIGRGAKVALVSLGCPKNLVDLQVVASALRGAGFDVGVPEADTDAILVNTCAFIESAREEAVSAIAEACSRKARRGSEAGAFAPGVAPFAFRGLERFKE